MEKTSQSVREFSTKLREREGEDIVARLAWKEISKHSFSLAVVNGLRSRAEYGFFFL